jgi:hypothetical protein
LNPSRSALREPDRLDSRNTKVAVGGIEPP